MKCSKQMQEYFTKLEEDCQKNFDFANRARKLGIDPKAEVEVTLAKTLSERVIGLISVIAPQLKNTAAPNRISELENKFGVLDWRVAFKIAEEVAEEKFCKFKDRKQAIEMGLRVGFAYATLGVVSAPIEGLTSIDIKPRLDGKGEYFCLNFSGPVRNAGGTAAAVSVIIGDYLRKKFGYEEYDPTEKEIQRCHAEITDYHERVTNLQYFPSEKESEFLMRNLPVEIGGEPSEKFELSNAILRDLPRISTNIIRSGYCLIHSSCLPLKAPKLWANLKEWGNDFNLGHWSFLEEYVKIQKKTKAAGQETKEKVNPDFTYIKDLVSGRPVLGHPLANGAFRIRYGRSRNSGYSCQSIHPATMIVSCDFVANGTQLKVERPGKAAAMSCCDTIEGPVVKLKNGDVLQLKTEKDARRYNEQVEEILYLGDVLINYGDFFDRAHPLVPPGYCEEIWALEVEKACQSKNIEGIPRVKEVIDKPMETKISLSESLEISEKLNIPLHPHYTYYWNSITKENLTDLLLWLRKAKVTDSKIILPKNKTKRVIELLGVPHMVATENVVIEGDYGDSLLLQLGIREGIKNSYRLAQESKESVLDIINLISNVEIRDKCGTFMGSRMGRPEKAKMRKMKGSPHGLFPVGEQGGRLRSLHATIEEGKITSNFKIYSTKAGEITPYTYDYENKTANAEAKIDASGNLIDQNSNEGVSFKKFDINIRDLFRECLNILETKIFPDVIKGVRGTSSKEHHTEHLAKGILRAMHDLNVNKDGTVRYDCSETPLTHFKPMEIGASVNKLKKLGYKKDIYGKILKDPEQILELKPQDIVLPCCSESPDEPCDDVLFRIASFVDEMLIKLYNSTPFYNLQSKKNLIGHYVIGLAPHTSAGMLGRIIGFSQTQGFLAHPFFHAAMRRDCDGDESCILLLMDAFLNFSPQFLPNTRGATMDAPLVLTSVLNPSEVDDMAFKMDIAEKYPLEFYEATMKYKMPWEVKVKQIQDILGTEAQFEGTRFTHNTSNINSGVLCSAYKTLPSMQEKLESQMELAAKIRAVDKKDVARLVIEKHFIRDTKGNLRKFSQQQFRCVGCNEKFRRPPLIGRCTECNGKLIFTVSEGFITKYLEPSLSLAKKFEVPSYLQQSLELLRRRVEEVFGKEKEKQEALGKWFE